MNFNSIVANNNFRLKGLILWLKELESIPLFYHQNPLFMVMPLLLAKQKAKAHYQKNLIFLFCSTPGFEPRFTMSSRAIYRDASGMPHRPKCRAKLDKTAFLRFFVCFTILSAVRKLGVKNTCHFADLRTFKKKRLEI